MTHKSIPPALLWMTALLSATLACRAVTSLFIPASDFPTPLPAAAAPKEETTAPAYCPQITDQIMRAASAIPQESDAVDNGSRSNDNEIVLVTYQVSGNDIGDPYYENVSSSYKKQQNDTTTHKQIWDYFTSLIPQEQRRSLAEYSVMTDGQDNLLAAVAQTYDDPNLWSLEVDIADAADAYNLTFTLIHEFGHLLTLNSSQVPPSLPIFNNPEDNALYLKESAACPQYFPGEGCSQPDSYINAFFVQFWSDIHQEWLDINQEEDDDVYYQRLDDFYHKYEDRFVTDYAATNPEEDIAESWAFFVLGGKPNGSSMAEKKILFFYSYPELVQLREQILGNLCSTFPK